MLLACHGCGPFVMPMVPRLAPDQQASVDAAWSSALAPPDRLDRQALLDGLMASHAYQVGVDRMTYRSEKSFDAGMAVMDIAFDRMNPGVDRFTVTIFDRAGRIVRQEHYDRALVENTYSELFVESAALECRAQRGALQAGNQQRLDELHARQRNAQALFPNFETDGTDDQRAPD